MEDNTKKQSPIQKIKSYGTRNWIRVIWLGFFGTVIGLFLLFFLIAQGFLGDMPDVKELENPDIYVASEIISSDGVVLGKFEKEKTKPVTYKELPPHLVYALQAKEDERFREHSGIDLKSIGRAIYYRGERGGGSTITQQLAKLLFTGTASQNKIQRAFQKLKEWVVAVSLEKRYTKEEIITLYFNKFDFLFNAKGIEMASRVYFNKSTKDLSLSEAATFVAMLENPRKNNPYRKPETALARRNTVLKQMLETKYISQDTYDIVLKEPIVVDFHEIESVQEDYSAYYKFTLKKDIDNYLKDYSKQSGKELNLYKDGLKIFVTLDSKMQKYAEEAIKEHMTNLQRSFDAEQRRNPKRPFYFLKPAEIENIMMAAVKRTGRYKQYKAENMPEDSIMMEFKKPIKTSIFTWKGEEQVEMSPWDSIRYHKQIAQAGLMSMEPSTGDIKAWVGGIDWKHFQYDHVKQGKRQVGSTFKPFVYATAIINLGMTPCTQISNATYVKGPWKVEGSGGSVAMKDGLAHSKNPIAVRLIEAAGAKNVIKLARDLGVTEDIPNELSVALGSSDITIYEMLGAYSTFANYGNYIKPEMIWRIEDANGRVIKEVKPVVKEVMNVMHAYTMIDMMKGVADFGTASGELKRMGINSEIAAKTGTTQNNSDGWFMGITPKLATGVWVGWEDRATHFWSTGEGQGAKMALPIWGIFMKKIYADKTLNITPEDKFEKPSDWTENCSDLQGLGGYGDEGGLQTIDELKNPKPKEPTGTTNSNSGTKKATRKEEDINATINQGEEVDFNK